MLDMTESGIRRAILDGRLPAQKFGKSWMINRQDVTNYTRSAAGKPRKDRTDD